MFQLTGPKLLPLGKKKPFLTDQQQPLAAHSARLGLSVWIKVAWNTVYNSSEDAVDCSQQETAVSFYEVMCSILICWIILFLNWQVSQFAQQIAAITILIKQTMVLNILMHPFLKSEYQSFLASIEQTTMQTKTILILKVINLIARYDWNPFVM